MGLREQFDQADRDLKTWQEWLPRISGLFSQGQQKESVPQRAAEGNQLQVTEAAAKAASS